MVDSKVVDAVCALFTMLGFLQYWRMKAHVTSSQVTWLIWTVLDSIALAGMLVKGTQNGAIVASVIGAWMTTILAFRHGRSQWTNVDRFCLGGAVLGIGMWAVTNNPTVGIAISLSVIVLGSIPIFIIAWRDFRDEDRFAWLWFFISAAFSLLGVKNWTIDEAAQPASFTLIEGTMVFLVWIRPLLLKKKEEVLAHSCPRA